MSPDKELAALELAERARTASRALARSSSQQRERALRVFAEELESPAVASAVEMANAADLRGAAGHSAAFLDRLRVDGPRLEALARAVREIAALPDPVGGVVDEAAGLADPLLRGGRLAHGAKGTFHAVEIDRPPPGEELNLTGEETVPRQAATVIVLRGGSEALQSNSALVAACQRALERAGLPEDAVQLVPPDRALLDALLQHDRRIDLCIPRGGKSLIDFIDERSRIPVIKHDQGVCHLYVAADADLDEAERIAVNAKAQRPGVCNALECLLVDSRVAEAALPRLGRALRDAGVQLRADARALPLLPEASAAAPDDFGREFLDLVLAVAVVDGIEGALGHIARYGSRHTEAICTRDTKLADRFVREVDASCALVNASTRFNDGGELGLGAEIGISTSKLHAYGPMGLRELTCTRFVVRGDGQVRT